MSVRLHHAGHQGAKPKEGVVADILASICEQGVMRVLFDVTVLEAAARSHRRAANVLLAQVLDAGFQTFISVMLFAFECVVLLRPENPLERMAPPRSKVF